MKALHIWHSKKIISLDYRPIAAEMKFGPTFQSNSASRLHRLLPAPSFSSCDLLSLREPRLERRFWECGVFLIKFLPHESHVTQSSPLHPMNLQ